MIETRRTETIDERLRLRLRRALTKLYRCCGQRPMQAVAAHVGTFASTEPIRLASLQNAVLAIVSQPHLFGIDVGCVPWILKQFYS
jgi:hypothetical protein